MKRTDKNLKVAIGAVEELFKIKTVREVATLVGFSTQYVNRWKKTGVPKRLDLVLKLEKHSKISRYKFWPELKDML